MSIDDAIASESFIPIFHSIEDGNIEKGFEEADHVLEGDLRYVYALQVWTNLNALLIETQPKQTLTFLYSIHRAAGNNAITDLFCSDTFSVYRCENEEYSRTRS